MTDLAEQVHPPDAQGEDAGAQYQHHHIQKQYEIFGQHDQVGLSRNDRRSGDYIFATTKLSLLIQFKV